MIIGIFGQMHNGKSTLVDCMFNELHSKNRRAYVKGFALPIYETLCFITNTPIEELKKNKELILPGWNKTVRETLQWLGEGMRQHVHAKVWIHKQLVRLGFTIIDDGRHENEAKVIHEAGGKNILIIRPTHINQSNHPSESWIREIISSWFKCKNEADSNKWKQRTCIDYVVQNSGSLNDLYDWAREFVESINA